MATLVKVRTAVTDDDGTGTTGTIANQAWLTGLENEIDDFGASLVRHVCQGRMTLTTALPVTIADVTAATTIRYALYAGNQIALYDGSEWDLFTFAELSLALGADAADKNYDLFAYNSGGTVTLERLVWTNDTTRATALTTQDGVLVKTGDTTRRYLGTYRTTGVAGQTEDSFAKRLVWNYYYRVPRPMRVVEATDTWTYTTSTFRQANASTANQLALVVGVAEVPITVEVLAHFSNTNAGVEGLVGIGEDSTSAKVTGSLAYINSTSAASEFAAAMALYRGFLTAGYHFYARLEWSAATGTMTWYGDNGGALHQTGISGTIEG